MSVKLTEWRLKMTENVASVLAKLNSAADKTGAKMGGVGSRLSSAKIQTFANEIPMAGRAMDLLTSRAALMGSGVAAAGVLLYKSGQAALTYEQAMAKVNATAQLTPEELNKLKNELMDIGENSAGNFMRIPDAFERINSQVNNVTQSIDILKVANKGAQAAFVDIDLAAGALAQTLSIVGNRDSAGGIMDMLLKAKAVGAGEFSDFATYLPQLIASGDNLSIGHKDVSGLFAYMTAKGQSTADSAMLLQNAFTAMGKSDIHEKMAKQGLHLFNKDGSIKDLGVFFSELHTKLSRFSAEGKSNFLEAIGLKDAQAKNAFSVLANDAEKLKTTLDQVRNNAGELNVQLEKTQNHGRTWSEIGDQIKRGMVGLGEYILPILDKILMGASAWKNYLSGDHEKNNANLMVNRLHNERAEAERLAMAVTKERVPNSKVFGPALWENQGEKLTGKAKDVYRYTLNYEMAKRTGAFGGDYDKFLAEQKARMAPKDPDKKKGFKSDKNKKEGLQNISEGGKAPRIINVNFGKLNENIIIQPQSLKEGTGEIAQNMEAMLVRIITGTEASVANE